MFVDGKLLQTNKKYSALKQRQKDKIAEWMYLSFKEYIDSNSNQNPTETNIVAPVLERIYKADIWIPDSEIYSYYRRSINRMRKRYEREKNNP